MNRARISTKRKCKKLQTEITELKNIMTELKNTIKEFNNRFNEAPEKISKL